MAMNGTVRKTNGSGSCFPYIDYISGIIQYNELVGKVVPRQGKPLQDVLNDLTVLRSGGGDTAF